MSEPIRLIDLIHEYVSERIPRYEFIITAGKYLEVKLPPRFESYVPRLLAMIQYDYAILTLPNGKIVRIDVFCEDSIDVIYRIIRLAVAKVLRERRVLLREWMIRYTTLYSTQYCLAPGVLGPRVPPS